LAARQDEANLRVLADYAIDRHYPELADAPRKYLEFFRAVTDRQASLIARWQLVGFIHGVMNTDNMAISGETIDYGPCAFMDSFHPDTVYSSIDYAGRYAYGNQPRIAFWNLARLAEALLPLLGDDNDAAVAQAQAQAALDAFPGQFAAAYQAGLRAKLGLFEAHDDDAGLAKALLACMAANEADFTLTWRRLSDAAGGEDSAAVRTLFKDGAAFDAWDAQWRARLALEGGPSAERREAMRRVNPAFIPRNHLVQAVITAALGGDFSKFEDLLSVLAQPFDDQPGQERYAAPPLPEQVVLHTFCGT